MSSVNLAATFSPRPNSSELEAYWLRLEQVEFETDEISVKEAAELIDAAFLLEPCEGDGSMSGGGAAAVDPEEQTEESAAEPIEYEAFNFFLRDKMHFSGCQMAADGSYEAQLKVYRSHQDEGYELNVTGGELLEDRTVQVQEQVSERLEVNGASITCKYPVVGAVSLSDGEVKSVKGSTINLVDQLRGTVTVDHLTQYDLVTIAVDGDPDNPGAPMECTVFGFFHGTADDETISPPPVDEAMSAAEKAAWCPDISFEIDPDRGKMTCYEYHTMVEKCRCSGARADLETLEVQVDCPEYLQCPDSSDCRQFLASKLYVSKYVTCPGEEGQDICGDVDYVTELCCGYTPAKIPPCCKVSSVYRGGAEIDGGPEKYKAEYGDNVRLVALLPDDGICGDIIDTYTAPDNCCDGVEQLSVNEAESVEVIADNSVGWLVIEGGKDPLTVTVLGNGFYLAVPSLLLTAEFEGRNGAGQALIPIYTGDACGTCTVHISDGCSETEHVVRSTTGVWNRVYYTTAGGVNGNPLAGVAAYPGGCRYTFERAGSYGTMSGIKGGWKVEQLISNYSAATSYHRTQAEALARCLTREGQYPASTGFTNDGGCFYGPTSCHGCGTCINPTFDYRSIEAGFMAKIVFNYRGGVDWDLTSMWNNVERTEIWEWVC